MFFLKVIFFIVRFLPNKPTKRFFSLFSISLFFFGPDVVRLQQEVAIDSGKLEITGNLLVGAGGRQEYSLFRFPYQIHNLTTEFK